jgi:hypothetical protein
LQTLEGLCDEISFGNNTSLASICFQEDVRICEFQVAQITCGSEGPETSNTNTANTTHSTLVFDSTDSWNIGTDDD